MSKNPTTNDAAEAAVTEITLKLVLGPAVTTDEMLAFDAAARESGMTREERLVSLIRESIDDAPHAA